MKWLFLLGLLAVSSVWASPNAAKESEGGKLTLNERSKREVADVGGEAEGERHTRKKRDAEESGESSELDLDVDINVGGSRGKSDIDIDVNVGPDQCKDEDPMKPDPEATTTSTKKPTTQGISTTVEPFSRLFCEKCGRSKVTMPRIVAGSIASVHEYPWLVFLHMRTLRDSFTCGGSLITKDYVLTAAHCVFGKIETIHVYPSAHKYPDLEGKDEYRIESSEVIIHEKYDDFEKQNDIALVKLKEPVSFGSKISPACLAKEDDMQTLAVVAGWGRLTHDDPDALPKQLMEVALDISDHDDCKSMYEGTVDITDNMICTYTVGKDACVGDSGGPLLIEAGLNTWVQVGVVSFGAGCAGDAPGVYTRVSKYVDWIESHIKEPKC